MATQINFSGHPVAGFELAPWVGKNLPVEADPAPLRAAVREALAGLSCDAALKAGAPAEIVLPGMAPAAAMLLAEWHGRYGSFPTIRWSVRGPGGFAWPETAKADLQSVRLDARTGR